VGEGEVQSAAGVRRGWFQAERERLRVTARRLLRGPEVDVSEQGQGRIDAAHSCGALSAPQVLGATEMLIHKPTSSRTGHWGEGITAEDMTALRWVKPKIVVEVSFVEWTLDGLLRHPEFIGVRDDKAPREIRRKPE